MYCGVYVIISIRMFPDDNIYDDTFIINVLIVKEVFGI